MRLCVFFLDMFCVAVFEDVLCDLFRCLFVVVLFLIYVVVVLLLSVTYKLF